MIRAMIFDLDGTLVQTEKLKALSYAKAALELCPHDISEEEVLAEFKIVVGLSRREVSEALVEKFNLRERAEARMSEEPGAKKTVLSVAEGPHAGILWQAQYRSVRGEGR